MNLSIVIPTHERYSEILNLTDILLQKYTSAKIVIIDTSKKINNLLSKIKNPNLKYIYLSDNLGISYSRNLGLSSVDNDFILFMDDDFIINNKSRILEFKNELLNLDYDVLGGEVNNMNTQNYNFHGKYNIIKNTLYHYISLNNSNGTYDIIFNYFIAKTQRIIDIGGWDNNLKFAREHDDFFLKGKQYGLRIGYNESFGIDHIHSGKKYYEEHEANNKGQSIKYFCKKWGILSKVEIRLMGIGKNKYLSIYRFMGDKYIGITEEQIKQIYEEYEVEYGSIPFTYKHIGYE